MAIEANKKNSILQKKVRGAILSNLSKKKDEEGAKHEKSETKKVEGGEDMGGDMETMADTMPKIMPKKKK